MNDRTKITLSKKEKVTIKNTDFFRRKKDITDKIFHAFASIVKQANSEEVFTGLNIPIGTDVLTGKISKGENYKGLPYIVLDYPRKFTSTDVFAIRTIFWWGNPVACTLLLDGDSAKQFAAAVGKHYSLLKKKDAFICVNESAWHHHFEDDNYVAVKKFSKAQFEKHITQHSFIKIAFKLPLSKIERMQSFALKSFGSFKEILSTSTGSV